MRFFSNLPTWLYRLRNKAMDVYIRYRTARTPAHLLVGLPTEKAEAVGFIGPIDFTSLRELQEMYARYSELLRGEVMGALACRLIPEARGVVAVPGSEKFRYTLEFFFPHGEVFVSFPHAGKRIVYWTTLQATIDDVGDMIDALAQIFTERDRIRMNT